MTTLSTHVLDTRLGAPAPGMGLELSRPAGDDWVPVVVGVTGEDGRFGDFGDLRPGTYRLVFETGRYGNDFYPLVPVIFVIDEDVGHLHIPLLLSPYGYTTYRGS